MKLYCFVSPKTGKIEFILAAENKHEACHYIKNNSLLNKKNLVLAGQLISYDSCNDEYIAVKI